MVYGTKNMMSGPILCQLSEQRNQKRKEERSLKMNIMDFVLCFTLFFFGLSVYYISEGYKAC